MKPNFSQLIFASRYMLPLWLGLGLWLWLSGHWERIWGGLDEDARGLTVLFLCAMVAGTLKVFPKVWAYEQGKRDAAAAAHDPEQVKRRRRFMLGLLAVAGWGLSLWWLSEKSYAENSNVYMAAFVVGAGGSLWALFRIYARLPGSLKTRLRGPGRSEDRAFIVRCSLPIMKHAPDAEQIQAGLPDYCERLLSSEGNSKKSESTIKIPELVNP